MDLSTFDPSQALGAILTCDLEHIVTRTSPNLPPYLILEALAQSCGMHLRFRHDFFIDAFLASTKDLIHRDYPAPVVIEARLTAETSAAASYEVRVNGNAPCRMLMGYRPAPENTFFRDRFQCLINPSSTP